ncbi:MAG: indolepyruvate oxidoreductase subunit beta [Deferrisomatales bacterium]|nr:indolepyruvate oxidoreductase subunit beta [Deferrisomatales bacterium]
MTNPAILPHDPFNLIVAGVGGQGTVTASRLIGEMLSARGIRVTIGETFGASQRGGSVTSHLRLSARTGWSPQIPRGQAHLVVAFEPSEGLRVLGTHGNPQVVVVANTRPIHPESVMGGEARYPEREELGRWMGELASRAVFVEATDEALRMGSPILANTIMVGAVSGLGLLPLGRDDFERLIAARMGPDRVPANLTAFDWGVAAVAG